MKTENYQEIVEYIEVIRSEGNLTNNQLWMIGNIYDVLKSEVDNNMKYCTCGNIKCDNHTPYYGVCGQCGEY